MNFKAKLTVFAMAIGIFLCMLDTTVMNIALPAIQTGLNVNLEQLSWALNVYTITFAVFTIPLGRLADILGRNKVYISGLLIFITGSALSGFANDAANLIIGRCVQSLGAAIIFPASMTIGISTTDLSHRTGVVATLGVTQGLAAALGPTVGGIVTQYLGWRWVFFINIPLIILALILCATLLTFKHEPHSNTQIDFPGMLLSMILLFSLTLALIKGSAWGWSSTAIIGLLGTSLLALILFLLVEQHVKAPMVPLELFQNRQFTGAVLAVVLSGIFLVAVLVILPTFFTKVQGKSELTAALMITPASVMIFIFSPISGFIINKIGPQIMVASGFIFMILGYLVLAMMDPNQYWQIFVACLLIGAGYGIIAGPIVVLGAANFTGALLTASQSVLGLFRQIGSVLAVAIFVSALTTNLNTAKTTSIRAATTQISTLTISKAAKTKMTRQATQQIEANNAQQKQPKRHYISSSQQKQLIQKNYQIALNRLNQQTISAVAQQAIYAKVAKKVKQQVKQDNDSMAQTARTIQVTTKQQVTQAFIRPYQHALPFIIFAGLSSLLFYRRKEYLDQN
ncbi:MFS transporter [Loigolactobacillus backii]|uniref:DHA2 family efflux MFS transporter permease subunit n=1 Tax=Loigolactobacillus backii TaxID=375175 RepID=UPI000C1CA036|nr:DHA2 family efflux MFS transporter permease subunit [Loigolactobacillus backii]PIO83331.1 MFS transporter [Loigolactobacillus backii]